MCNVLAGRLPAERMDPAPSFNWSHILGLKRAETERECVKDKGGRKKKREKCGRGCDTMLFKSCRFYKRNLVGGRSLELNPKDYQIKQLHSAMLKTERVSPTRHSSTRKILQSNC